jgi:hypothetical protein
MNARAHDLEDHWSQSFGDQQWRAFREMLISAVSASPAWWSGESADNPR